MGSLGILLLPPPFGSCCGLHYPPAPLVDAQQQCEAHACLISDGTGSRRSNPTGSPGPSAVLLESLGRIIRGRGGRARFCRHRCAEDWFHICTPPVAVTVHAPRWPSF